LATAFGGFGLDKGLADDIPYCQAIDGAEWPGNGYAPTVTHSKQRGAN